MGTQGVCNQKAKSYTANARIKLPEHVKAVQKWIADTEHKLKELSKNSDNAKKHMGDT
jgi:hypothetical protein